MKNPKMIFVHWVCNLANIVTWCAQHRMTDLALESMRFQMYWDKS